MQALERKVIGVITCFTGSLRPVDDSGADTFAHLLLLHVERLLLDFLPREAQVAHSRDGSQADGFPLREEKRAIVTVLIVLREEALGGPMREIAGRENVG